MDRYRVYIGVGVHRHSPSRMHNLQNGSETQTEPQGNIVILHFLYIPNTTLHILLIIYGTFINSFFRASLYSFV